MQQTHPKTDGNGHTEPGRDALSFSEFADLVTRRAEELFRSLRVLWSVRKDKAQLAFRRRIQTIACMGVAALAAGVAIVHAVILVVGGTGAGFRQLFRDRPWLGDLVAGALVLTLIGSGLAFGIRRSNRRQLQQQRAKYDKLHGRKPAVRAPTPGSPAH